MLQFQVRLDISNDWALRGRCRHGDPEALFVKGAQAQRDARRICIGCPVRFECLAQALDERIEWGVWGGMTEAERRALLRRNPRTRNWRPVLERLLNNMQR